MKTKVGIKYVANCQCKTGEMMPVRLRGKDKQDALNALKQVIRNQMVCVLSIEEVKERPKYQSVYKTASLY